MSIKVKNLYWANNMLSENEINIKQGLPHNILYSVYILFLFPSVPVVDAHNKDWLKMN